MSAEWRELLEKLPDYLGGHMLLSVAALALGIAVSLPLGIAASRRPKLAEALLGVAGILQTIPTMALLVLMVPLLGGLIGFQPALVALTAYSFLPILANTVIGIRGVDPTLIEAARGLGMSERQLLRGVQLPLAAPVIIAGVRTATVLVVGTATLATPVGGLSLGNYIFSGLEMNDMTATLFGCIFAALLALVMDQLVRLLEVAARRRSRALAYVALGGLALVLVGGLYGPIARFFGPQRVVLAGTAWTEGHVLNEALAETLRQEGLHVDRRPGMGETIQFCALEHNQVDCAVNYLGNIVVMLMSREGVDVPRDPKHALPQVEKYLLTRHGIVVLGQLGFENAYTFVMDPRKIAELETKHRVSIKKIEDLVPFASKLEIAGDTQFFNRPEWRTVCDTYGLRFKRTRAMTPTLMYDALRDDKVQVICAYSSDGRIKGRGLRRLEDTDDVFPRYDALLLLSKRAAKNPKLCAALRPLVGNVKQDVMEQANYAVDHEKQSPRAAAARLLATVRRVK